MLSISRAKNRSHVVAQKKFNQVLDWRCRRSRSGGACRMAVASRRATNIAANRNGIRRDKCHFIANQFHYSSHGNLNQQQPAKILKLLTELRAAFSAMPTNEAVAVIKQFLDSKVDASTHLGFKVAGNGLLDAAPTLRTFLLDELARLDPAAAANYAKIILAGKDSPDEWALALRNLARGDTSAEGRALLEQKTSEMLQYEPWRQNPSTGFLEAFDATVYIGGTSLMPTLTDLVRQQDNPAVAHASYLALDRIVINNPTMALAALLADPSLMQGRETTRADYFARADVRDPQQKQILKNYLLNPQISPAEIDAFVGIFPNANYMISPNLLTQSQTPNHAALVNRDAESLLAVRDWITDPRFAQMLPSLQKMQARLVGYVQQESQ